MLVSHARRFVIFPDPLDGTTALSRGFEPFVDVDFDARGRTSGPIVDHMSPAQVADAFAAGNIAFYSYLRVAVVENPFVRLVRLYNMIAATDPIWIAREKAGLGRPDFYKWLRGTRPDTNGAGSKHSPPWRRFGAWSARNWCGQHISHVIRKDAMHEDLTAVLAILGIAPAFDRRLGLNHPIADWEHYYDAKSVALVNDRYTWDLAQYGYRGPLLPCVDELAK